MTPGIQKVTWVKDGSITFESSGDGVCAIVDTVDHDTVLHVFVVYDDETTREWSADWDTRMPEWAKEAIDASTSEEPS